MAAIDFLTALGRLLNDGNLRDAFAADAPAVARQLGIRPEDLPTLLQLAPADLEFQARVLLHKRFGLVKLILPATCSRLGAEAWPEFARFSRTQASRSSNPVATDAAGFIAHLRQTRSTAVDPVEAHRSAFASQGRRFSLHFIFRAWLPGLQMLVRRGPDRWSEWHIHFGR